MRTTASAAVRLLDRRTNDGFDVKLLWNPRTDRIFVAIEDQRNGHSFEFRVDSTRALEAFYHPFTYTNAGSDRVSAPALATVGEREPGGDRTGGRGL